MACPRCQRPNGNHPAILILKGLAVVAVLLSVVLIVRLVTLDDKTATGTVEPMPGRDVGMNFFPTPVPTPEPPLTFSQ